jgi:hypothetical protein
VRLLLPALAVAVLTACGGGTAPVGAPSPVPSQDPTKAPSPVATSAPSPAAAPPVAAAAPWVVGASALPLRLDGFGQVLSTPEVLRDRRMTAATLLPPPAGGAFAATVSAVTPQVRERMGASWSRACPVGLDQLRYLTVSFRGFDGAPHTGEIVVHAEVAQDVVSVFRRLYAEGFPIEEMRLPSTADLEAAPTGDGNNTAGYVCRAARGQKTWSQHAYGRAVDINPFHNPLVKKDLVVPELASAYVDRTSARAGMHMRRGAAVRAFAAIGWEWGGDWRSLKDYMHFSQNGR